MANNTSGHQQRQQQQPPAPLPAHNKRNVKLKLPPQLVSIIQGEEQPLIDSGFLSSQGLLGCKRPAREAGLLADPFSSESENQQPGAVATEPPALMNVMLASSAVAAAADSSGHGPELDELAGLLADTGSAASARADECAAERNIFVPQGEGAHPAADSARHSVTQIVLASQRRFTKELCSYTRAVCMRLGYA